MTEELLEYFEGDELASEVWKSKYAQEGEKTPLDMFKRLSKAFGGIENKYKGESRKGLSKYGKEREELTEDKILSYINNFKYIIMQGSVMASAGTDKIASLSNCFVIDSARDSYGGIFKTDQEQVQLMKMRGGVGHDLSKLRPEGAKTNNAAKSSTGAVSFMHRFSNSTREVSQLGRRGALMLSIDITHPDSLGFINMKRDITKVTGANVSVKISNHFMEALERNGDYLLKFPIDTDFPVNMDKVKKDQIYFRGRKGRSFRKINTREYWDALIDSAWSSAEPGVIFEDHHHNMSPDGVYPQFKGVSTNPCGEIFMQPYDACRLIAINLSSVVDFPFTKFAKLNANKLYEVVYEAMRLSDNLVELELIHINRIISKIKSDDECEELKRVELNLWEKVKKTAMSSRRTGLGFTAIADMLASLGLRYGSVEAFKVVSSVMKIKFKAELDCTIDLAIQRGTFKGWDPEKEFYIGENGEIHGNNHFYERLALFDSEIAKRMYVHGRRNLSWSTVAPTGSVSILAQTSSGIEPVFMPYYKRRKKINPSEENVRIDFVDEVGDSWQEYMVIHKPLLEFGKLNFPEIDFDNISQEDIEKVFKESPYYGATANDIGWESRVDLQGEVQKYTTHSISSTVNLPNDVTKEEVNNIYIEAWRRGLKGITIYRDGSRSGVLVATDSNNKGKFNYEDGFKRPKEIDGYAHQSVSKGVKYSVIVGLIDDKPYEVFISNEPFSGKGKIIKKSRGKYQFVLDSGDSFDITSNMSDEQVAITRLTSTSLRHGSDNKFIVEQLRKSASDMFGFNNSLARVLSKYIEDGQESTVICDHCSSDNVVFEEGCNKCMDCGSSECS